jgi:tellurite resistance protein
MDLQENIERTKILAVALAFAVSAADNKLYDCEIELIKNWARDNILENSASDKDEHKLDKALEKTIAFFRGGNKLDAYNICDEIVGIAPVAQRYDILELCLYVAQSKGSVTTEELALLKNMADWLGADHERFRIMMEKVLPVEMHEVRDIETILGISSDMSREKVRKHLNKEYSKWNSRVTNSDPDIQSQADQMLKLIAEARSQYTADAIIS